MLTRSESVPQTLGSVPLVLDVQPCQHVYKTSDDEYAPRRERNIRPIRRRLRPELHHLTRGERQHRLVRRRIRAVVSDREVAHACDRQARDGLGVTWTAGRALSCVSGGGGKGETHVPCRRSSAAW